MMNERLLPPHLKVAETVTDEEYRKAKWQSQVILFSAIGLGIVAGGIGILIWGGLKGLLVGGSVGVAVERIIDRVLPDGKKMRTQRMKVYPELKNYLKRLETDAP